MKYLGIDYGQAKIGLAFSEGTLAEPLGILKTGNQKLLMSSLIKICEEHKIEKVILGISEGKMAEETREFAGVLRESLGIPVELEDETLTTQDAIAKMREVGKGSEKEDAVAAALILQKYLDFKENV